MNVSLLPRVLAQPTAVATLRRALEADRVHHAYLFDGPDGVGKELAAFGLAQALVCEQRGVQAPKDEACGECSACRRAVVRPGERKPVHPDVVVIERGLYEPAQIGRRTPETQDISVDQIRTLVLSHAAFRPHEGRAKIFVVRRADELSVSSANALLKTLEEPGVGTYFVLLSSRPDALLATIRSRTQRLRFGPLPDATVAQLLRDRGTDEQRAMASARLCGGSMAAALTLADDELSKARDGFVARALSALEARDMLPSLDLAEELKKQKGDLDVLLSALGDAIAQRARDLAEAGDPRCEVWAARHPCVLAASRQLDGNASAQLTVEAMMARMRTLGS